MGISEQQRPCPCASGDKSITETCGLYRVSMIFVAHEQLAVGGIDPDGPNMGSIIQRSEMNSKLATAAPTM